MFNRHPALLAAFVAILACGALRGDVLTLKSGQVFEGKVTQSGDTVTIETPHVTVAFDTSEVAGITSAPAPEETYDQRAADLTSSDADGWYQLGLFADGKGLYAKADEAYEKALAADPDHAGARRELGYVRYEGEWVPYGEAMEKQGYVQYRGRWVTPEEADRLKADDETRERALAVEARVKTLTFMITRGTADGRLRARDELVATSDPAALDPLVDALSLPSAAVRSAVLGALVNYSDDAAALAVLDVAMWDKEPRLRQQARVVLNRKQNPTALNAAITALTWDNETARYRASEVLSAIGDPKAIPWLIRYLSWTRPRRPAPRPRRRSEDVAPRWIVGYRAKVAANAVGYEPVLAGWRHGRIVIIEPDRERREGWNDFPQGTDELVLNYEALDALRAITGQDYRFDKTAWGNWYLANFTRRPQEPQPPADEGTQTPPSASQDKQGPAEPEKTAAPDDE